MNKSHQKILFTAVLVCYVLLMIIGAIIPDPQDVPVFAGNTKYFHFFGFILLAIIVYKTLNLYKCKHENLLAVVLLAVFIVLTEVLQLFVSTRHFSFFDMLIDAAGCAVGIGVYKWILYKR